MTQPLTREEIGRLKGIAEGFFQAAASGHSDPKQAAEAHRNGTIIYKALHLAQEVRDAYIRGGA